MCLVGKKVLVIDIWKFATAVEREFFKVIYVAFHISIANPMKSKGVAPHQLGLFLTADVLAQKINSLVCF